MDSAPANAAIPARAHSYLQSVPSLVGNTAPAPQGAPIQMWERYDPLRESMKYEKFLTSQCLGKGGFRSYVDTWEDGGLSRTAFWRRWQLCAGQMQLCDRMRKCGLFLEAASLPLWPFRTGRGVLQLLCYLHPEFRNGGRVLGGPVYLAPSDTSFPVFSPKHPESRLLPVLASMEQPPFLYLCPLGVLSL